MTPDLDAMAELLGDPSVMEYYPAPKTRNEAAEWIAWTERNYVEYGFGLWVIETHAGRFVGDCGLTWQEVGGVRRLEVGYHVTPPMQGAGLATEAAVACREFARGRGEPELVAIVHPQNLASRRVAEKVGMRVVLDDEAGAVVVFGMSLVG
jgi:RimJ/RimL family protein N-acetyltransferase